MSDRLVWYTCVLGHFGVDRYFPYLSTGGQPSVVFDTLHVMERPDGSLYLPNATEEQRRQVLADKGWVYEVVERWGKGRFECRRGWLCPQHAQATNRAVPP